MPSTPFDPTRHGFHFSNYNITWSYHGLGGGTMLCGGMAFAALDYYYSGVPIPADTTPPAEGTPLHTYIYERQVNAHQFAMPRLGAMGARTGQHTITASVSASAAFGVLKRWIDQGSPIPIVLGDSEAPLSTASHWVTAIGYETDGVRLLSLRVYDSNFPNEIIRMDPDLQRGRLSNSRRQHWGFYIPCDRYRHHHPNQPLEHQSNAHIWGIMPHDPGSAL